MKNEVVNILMSKNITLNQANQTRERRVKASHLEKGLNLKWGYRMRIT